MNTLGGFTQTVIYIGGISFLIQLFYYTFFYLRILGAKKKKESTASYPPVSVIICARNEQENLRKNLPLILGQEYDNYEVVVVDDCSSDDTELVLREFKNRYPHFRYTRILEDQKFGHGKKLALTVGIKSARYEWLLLTDADCYPTSRLWIRKMAEHFQGNTSVVLGYGGFERKKGVLNNWIRYDALFIAIQYLSYAIRGIPYMGVGRNLAYRKDLFFANRGFASHNHLASGDDDLFVCEVANRMNTQTEFSHLSHTRTQAKNSFRDWVDQKKRHLTTSGCYPFYVRFLLGLEPLSRTSWYLSLIFLLITGVLTVYVTSAFAVRLLLHCILINSASKKLNEKFLLLPSLLYDVIIPYFYLALLTGNIFNRRKSQWK